jgi:hypothetical protein
MANRFPLVLDTTDGNKIKEIPAGDNLDLRNTSIVDVQNINALGTINAAVVTVNGERLVAQEFANLIDTPSTYVGSESYFVKVNETGTALEYRPFSDIGNIELDTLTVIDDILPAGSSSNIGSDLLRFNRVTANQFNGDLASFNDEIVFDATTGKISYAALQGAPQFLSEFTDDIGFLQAADLEASLAGLFDEGVPFVTDIVGSVFGDDSTVLVDGPAGKIVGDIENSVIDTGSITALSIVTNNLIVGAVFGPDTGDMQIDAGPSGILDIGAASEVVNIYNAVLDTVGQGPGLGIAQITTSTDLAITAGNRIKIEGGVPFRIASTTTAEQLAIAGQNGDLIYNTTTARTQMYQNGAWVDVTGNVDATTGTSNFNDVVVAGNLTVQGTTTTIDTANTTIKDNVIVLNQGEIGAGVTGVTAGIEIERGSEANRSLVWTENFGGKWIVTDDATFLANRLEANYVVGGLSVSTDDLVMTDGNITATGTLTVGGFGQVQIVSVSTDIELLPVGKVLVDGNLEVTGNTTIAGSIEAAAFKGTFVGDDSTILVDGINNKIVAATIETVSITADDLVLNNGTVNGVLITSTIRPQVDGGADLGTTLIKWGVVYANNFVGSLQGPVTGNVTGDVVGNLTGNVVGDVVGSVFGDDSTILVDAVNNRFIGTLVGDIVGDMTGDPTLTLSTPGLTDGEIINLTPGGANNYINLVADNIRFFGDITKEIAAVNGVKGSIVGNDDTLLVDAATSTIPSVNISGSEATNWNTAYGWGDHSIVGYLTSVPGTYVQQGEQFVGDVTGTVFADDSSVMVDAVNYAFIGDTMTLNVLTMEPLEPVDGMIAVADGATWNPTASGVQTLVVYLGGAWRQIQTA